MVRRWCVFQSSRCRSFRGGDFYLWVETTSQKQAFNSGAKRVENANSEGRGEGGWEKRSEAHQESGKEKKEGGDARVERVVPGNAARMSEGGRRKSYGTGACKEEEEEEEEAVAVIAGVLRERFGPQIVREELEEWGSRLGSSEDEVGIVNEEEGGDEEEGEEEAEAEACEEDAPPTTSPPTRPPPLNSPRVVSPSSLLSLYRFFSSHLGISSPSTVASLLTSKPQLLRSNATNDLLPRVRLLQSYGISNADIVRITVREPAWLRVSLPQIQNTLEFLLAQGVRRSRLGFVLLHGQGLICSEARSTNLDILVEKAGVPVDKVGVVIEKYPSILTRSNEAVNTQLQMLSAYFTAEFGGKVETDSTSTSLLKQQLNEPHLDKNRLSKLILSCPVIFSAPPYRMAENIAILQSFTPPGTPNIATNVLQRAPTIVCLSSETLLAKLQFFVELVGKQAAGRVARSHPVVLQLSKENVQGKVAVLADLIGRENAVRVVTQFPLLLASSEDGLKESFRELVREVEEALESSGGERNGRQRLGEGDRGKCLAGEITSRALSVERCMAQRLVVDLVVRYPTSIYYSWKANLKPKLEYFKRDMGLSIMEVLALPFLLGYSLDRRIRPRHVALVRTGYVVVAREVANRRSGDRRGVSNEAGKQRSKVGSVSSLLYQVEGVEGSTLETSQESRKAVCLRKFLHCSDKQFEEKFGVTL